MITFSWEDIGAVFSVGLLETFLSLDNAVVLALIARKLPETDQKRALRYGLLGAIILRLLAVAAASFFIQYPWIKILGGLYLMYLVIDHFWGRGKDKEKSAKAYSSFWKTVIMIELTDLAFAVDSILAAVAISSSYWVIVFGGLLGVVAIRFAATKVIKLLDRFPQIETFAYILIAIAASKVIYEGAHSFW